MICNDERWRLWPSHLKNKFQSPQEDRGPSGGWESMRATDYRRRRAPRAAVTASKWEERSTPAERLH